MDALLFALLIFALIGYGIVSVVLFIIDCVKSRRQRRKVETGIKVMFITGLVAMVNVAAFFIFLMILAFSVANHM